jgi:hypothetical protein
VPVQSSVCSTPAGCANSPCWRDWKTPASMRPATDLELRLDVLSRQVRDSRGCEKGEPPVLLEMSKSPSIDTVRKESPGSTTDRRDPAPARGRPAPGVKPLLLSPGCWTEMGRYGSLPSPGCQPGRCPESCPATTISSKSPKFAPRSAGKPSSRTTAVGIAFSLQGLTMLGV